MGTCKCTLKHHQKNKTEYIQTPHTDTHKKEKEKENSKCTESNDLNSQNPKPRKKQSNCESFFFISVCVKYTELKRINQTETRQETKKGKKMKI